MNFYLRTCAAKWVVANATVAFGKLLKQRLFISIDKKVKIIPTGPVKYK